MASDSTYWRLLVELDTAQLGALERARAAAREVVWAQHAELTGQSFLSGGLPDGFGSDPPREVHRLDRFPSRSFAINAAGSSS